MNRRGGLRTFFAWLASFAMLMGAVAPTLSHALARQAPAWIQVCSAQGSSWIRTDASAPVEGSRQPAPGHAFEHCPYCSLHAAGLGMPPGIPDVPALSRAHAVHPHRVAAAPTLRLWSDAQSRGPPALS
jgi:hypothetical protein